MRQGMHSDSPSKETVQETCVQTMGGKEWAVIRRPRRRREDAKAEGSVAPQAKRRAMKSPRVMARSRQQGQKKAEKEPTLHAPDRAKSLVTNAHHNASRTTSSTRHCNFGMRFSKLVLPST